MSVLDREEINAFTKEIVEATTDAAKEAILAELTAGGAVKSVQRLTLNFAGTGSKAAKTVTAAINQVDTTKAVIIPMFFGAERDGYGKAAIDFESSTSIKGTRSDDGYYYVWVNLQVVEFY